MPLGRCRCSADAPCPPHPARYGFESLSAVLLEVASMVEGALLGYPAAQKGSVLDMALRNESMSFSGHVGLQDI